MHTNPEPDLSAVERIGIRCCSASALFAVQTYGPWTLGRRGFTEFLRPDVTQCRTADAGIKNLCQESRASYREFSLLNLQFSSNFKWRIIMLTVVWRLAFRLPKTFAVHLHLHLSRNREGRGGITDDFTTSFLHSSLFSTVPVSYTHLTLPTRRTV